MGQTLFAEKKALELKSELAVAKKLIATLEAELSLYKQKYRDEVDNNEYKTKYRELLDSHWDWKLRQKSLTELNYDGDETPK
jgi:phage host-nuclease inhibitor protein Gam